MCQTPFLFFRGAGSGYETNQLCTQAFLDTFSIYTDFAPSLPLPYFLPFTCGHVNSRVVSHGVEYKERLGKHPEAVQLLEELLTQHVYGHHHRGKWWDRLALNYDFHLKDKAKVLVMHSCVCVYVCDPFACVHVCACVPECACVCHSHYRIYSTRTYHK